jgi:hypothetical protein
MKIVSLAAGVAVGYVLGSRAGREKYEQIVANVRRISSGVPTQDRTRDPLRSDSAAPAPTEPATLTDPPPAAVTRPQRRKPTTPVPGLATEPLV